MLEVGMRTRAVYVAAVSDSGWSAAKGWNDSGKINLAGTPPHPLLAVMSHDEVSDLIPAARPQRPRLADGQHHHPRLQESPVWLEMLHRVMVSIGLAW